MTPRRDVLEKRIRELAKDSENVTWEAETHEMHVAERMERRGIDDMMMFEVLRTGYLEDEIKPGKNPGEWKGKMVKKMRGQREVGVVTIVIHNARLFIKTVEWED